MPKQSTFPLTSPLSSDVIPILRGYTGPNTGADYLAPAGAVAGILNGSSGNITFYGAVSGQDAGAAIAKAAAANSLVIIPAGVWPIASVPTIPVDVIIEALPGASFSGSGATALNLTNGALNQTIEYNTSGSDYATDFIFRNANHTGGTPGNTLSALNVRSTVAATVTNYEWAFLSVLNNSAAAGQNVAIYGQGNQETNTTGPTWAGVFEVIDHSGQVNPTNAILGIEVDCRAVGGDSSSNRIPIHVVASRPTGGGAAATIGIGILIDNNNDGANTSYGTGIFLGNKLGALCTFVYGIDISQATCTSGAIRLGQGQPILMDAAGVNQWTYNGAGLDYSVSGVLKTRLLPTGGLQVASAQVVGPQITGYGTPTGATKISSFPGGSATLLQCSEMIAQLVTDLKTHGLLGG